METAPTLGGLVHGICTAAAAGTVVVAAAGKVAVVAAWMVAVAAARTAVVAEARTAMVAAAQTAAPVELFRLPRRVERAFCVEAAVPGVVSAAAVVSLTTSSCLMGRGGVAERLGTVEGLAVTVGVPRAMWQVPMEGNVGVVVCAATFIAVAMLVASVVASPAWTAAVAGTTAAAAACIPTEVWVSQVCTRLCTWHQVRVLPPPLQRRPGPLWPMRLPSMTLS